MNEPRVYTYTRKNDSTPISSHHVIYDQTHPVLEPDFYLSTSPFEGWFGIPFPSPLSFKHIRAPPPTEILTLCGLSVLIPLYPATLSSLQIRSLVLHILSLHIMNHITHNFLYRVVPPIIPSSLQTKCVSINTQYISNCFILQPMPASDQWVRAYNDNHDTKVLLDRLPVSAPIGKPTILHHPVAYRTAIARNLLGILEGIGLFIMNQSPLLLTTSVVLSSQFPFVVSFLTLCMLHLSPVIWGNIKPSTVLN